VSEIPVSNAARSVSRAATLLEASQCVELPSFFHKQRRRRSRWVSYFACQRWWGRYDRIFRWDFGFEGGDPCLEVKT
jgi:hypothetical protein